jgi:hypothetical protein
MPWGSWASFDGGGSLIVADISSHFLGCQLCRCLGLFPLQVKCGVSWHSITSFLTGAPDLHRCIRVEQSFHSSTFIVL